MILRSRAGWPSALYVCSTVAIFAIGVVVSDSPLMAQDPPIRSAHHQSLSSADQSTSTEAQSSSSSPLRVAVERPWRDVEIGAPQTEGASAWNGGVIAVVGSGIGSRDTSDQMHFTYSRLIGDGDIVARLIVLDDEHPLASGGIVIRSSLAPDAAYAGLIGTNLNGIGFERRLGQGWSALTTPSDAQSTHVWLKLERSGFLVIASVSQDGIDWTVLGADTIELGPDAYVGFAVASHRQSDLATATFDSVSMQPVDDQPDQPDPAPSDGTDPSPQPPIDPVPVPPEPAPVLPVIEEPPVVEPAPPAPPPQELTPPEPSPPVIPPPEPSPDPPPTQPPASVPSESVPAPSDPSPVTSTPHYLVFEPSADDATNVDSYMFEVFGSGTVGVPLLREDLGKPAVISGECEVDISAFLQALPPGSYVVSVRAVNAYGTSDPALSATFAR